MTGLVVPIVVGLAVGGREVIGTSVVGRRVGSSVLTSTHEWVCVLLVSSAGVVIAGLPADERNPDPVSIG
jgi:hypothetical protein